MSNKRIEKKKATQIIKKYEDEFLLLQKIMSDREELLTIDGSCQFSVLTPEEENRYDFLEEKLLEAGRVLKK